MKKKLLIVCTVFALIILLLFGAYKLMNARTFQLFGTLTSKVETSEKVVAITFDDGPTDNVNTLLPLLETYDAKATFFFIGNELERNLDLGRLVVEAGHQVGNHSYSHDRMVLKTPSFIRTEIEKTNKLIQKIGFTDEIMFRPPYGKKFVVLPYYLQRQKIRTVMWNIEPDTNYMTVEDKVNHVVNNVTPGSIILMHAMYDDEELVVVEKILDTLTKRGYTFVTVSQLLR